MKGLDNMKNRRYIVQYIFSCYHRLFKKNKHLHLFLLFNEKRRKMLPFIFFIILVLLIIIFVKGIGSFMESDELSNDFKSFILSLVPSDAVSPKTGRLATLQELTDYRFCALWLLYEKDSKIHPIRVNSGNYTITRELLLKILIPPNATDPDTGKPLTTWQRNSSSFVKKWWKHPDHQKMLEPENWPPNHLWDSPKKHDGIILD